MREIITVTYEQSGIRMTLSPYQSVRKWSNTRHNPEIYSKNRILWTNQKQGKNKDIYRYLPSVNPY